jgi:hypothetical protein
MAGNSGHSDSGQNIKEMSVAGETIVQGGAIVHDSGAPIAQPIEKICCVCGENVAGKPRMKDKEGRYWCYECGMADTQRKRQLESAAAGRPASDSSVAARVETVPCPDCQQQFTPPDLVEFEGKFLCPGCIQKRKLAKRRAEARIAAAEEEAREAERRRRMMMLGGGVVAVLFLLYMLTRLFS